MRWLESKRGAMEYTGLLVLPAIHPIDYSALFFPLLFLALSEGYISFITPRICSGHHQSNARPPHARAFSRSVQTRGGRAPAPTAPMYSHRSVCHHVENGIAAITAPWHHLVRLTSRDLRFTFVGNR